MEEPTQLNRLRSVVRKVMDQKIQSLGTDVDTLSLENQTVEQKKLGFSKKANTLGTLPLNDSFVRTRSRQKTTLARFFTTFLGKQQDSSFLEPVTPPVTPKVNRFQSLVKNFIKTSKKTVPITQKALGPEGVRKKFYRSFQILRIIHRLNRISEDIQLYGTSSNLFDLTTRERTRVRKILYPSVLDETEEQMNEEKNMKWYVIHPKSRIRLIWSFVILFVLAYTATITPYRLTFEDTAPIAWIVIDYTVDLLFLVDMIMNFVSAYYDEEGKLVKDPKTLVKKYLKSWFIIDLLAVFPFDLVQTLIMGEDALSGTQANLNTFVRLLRLPRLYKVVRIMRINSIFKFLRGTPFLEWLELHSVFVKLLSFFVVVVTLMHIMACIWYLTAKLDSGNPNTWLVRGDFTQKSNASIYITSLYYIFTTLATVGYGDIHSVTIPEKVLSLVLMSLGVAFYSFTIGLIASTLSSRENRESSLKRKISIANEFSDEIKAPRTLKTKIAKILEYNSYRNCFSWADKKEIFGEIPISLRYEIVMTMHNGILNSIPFFREHSDKYFVVTIAEVLKPLRVKPRDYLWKEGDSAESMYFLITGKVHLISSEFLTPDDRVNNQKTSIIFKRFMSGSYFGEIELISKRERKYSLQASSEAELFYLTKHDYFNVLVREFPHIHEEFKEIALERDRRNIESLIEIKNFLQAHIPLEGRRATTIMATKLDPKIFTNKLGSTQDLGPMSTTSIEGYPTYNNLNAVPDKYQSDPKIEENEPVTSVFPSLKINNLFPKNVPIQNRRRALDVDSEIRKLSCFNVSHSDGPVSLLGKLNAISKKSTGSGSGSSSGSPSNSLSNILEKSSKSESSDDDSSSNSQSQSQSNSSPSDSSLGKSVNRSRNAETKLGAKINIGPPIIATYNPPSIYSFPPAQFYRSKSSSLLKTLQPGQPKVDPLRRSSTQKFKRRSREKSLLKLAIGAETEEPSPKMKDPEWKTVKEGEEHENDNEGSKRKQAVYEVKKVQKKGEKKVASLKTTIKDSDQRIRNLEDRFQRVIQSVQNVMKEE